MPISLSPREARKIALHAQLLFNSRGRGTGAEATLTAIEHLGYVQIDTLSVVERAHHHTLWNRLGRYRPQHIDQLQRERCLFEHWAHALAYLPMKDYRFSLPMMQRIAAGEIHWYRKDVKQCKKVLHLHIEKPLKNSELFMTQLTRELKRFSAFNGCDKILVHRISYLEKPVGKIFE